MRGIEEALGRSGAGKTAKTEKEHAELSGTVVRIDWHRRRKAEAEDAQPEPGVDTAASRKLDEGTDKLVAELQALKAQVRELLAERKFG
jgi:hypothetical protein